MSHKNHPTDDAAIAPSLEQVQQRFESWRQSRKKRTRIPHSLWKAAYRVMGRNTVLAGTPSCSAPVLNGQNTAAWHKLGHYACTMTGVASSATGLTRYYQRAGIDTHVVCFTGDGCAQDIGFQTMSGAAERNEKMIYICYDN